MNWTYSYSSDGRDEEVTFIGCSMRDEWREALAEAIEKFLNS